MACLIAFGAQANACTNFLLKAADGTPVYARTMEYSFELQPDVVVVPRNYEYVGTGPGNKPGIRWKSRYAVVGVMSGGQPVLADGMNEKGLAGGNLYFPGFAGYTDPAKADPAKSIASWEFLTWVLTNFATVAEVKAALNNVSIVDIKAPVLDMALPFHFPLHDATGASIVIEPIGGQFKVYDNPLGVLTNSPTFDWHLNNVRNYVKISPVDADPMKIGGQTFEPFGQGSGLLGIPGDPTPPSRFIRALGYVASAKQLPDGPQTIKLAEHILNNFDIPVGSISTAPKGGQLEYTQWSSIADLRAKRYYIKSYQDQTLRVVDLAHFNLDGKTLSISPFKPNNAPPALNFSKS
ncbi:linear amide C-N hydrolase [Cupriavidus sp.]|uniref:linear amide C-N hydrolase n=1 Tax=Cupriavidus sp. TaxID=1873897 RepID=UPI003D0B1AAF